MLFLDLTFFIDILPHQLTTSSFFVSLMQLDGSSSGRGTQGMDTKSPDKLQLSNP